MRLELVSFGGSSLNNSNFRSYLLGQDGLQPDSAVTVIERAGTTPFFGNKTFKERDLPLAVELLGTLTTQVNTVKGIFDTFDSYPRRLVVQDLDNSSRQWYLDATPVTQTLDGRLMTVGLRVPDPIWRTVNTSSISFTATSSPWEYHGLYVNGNRESFPLITLRGTTLKGGAFYQFYRYQHIYTRHVTPNITNPFAGVAAKPVLSNYPLDITGGGLNTAALVATSHTHLAIAEASAIGTSQTSFQVMLATSNTDTSAIPRYGMAYFQGEQITYTSLVFNTVACMTGVTRAVNGTTAITHGCGASVQISYMQADGDDLRVFIDGTEHPRWLHGVNTSSTKIWVTRDWRPSFTVKTAASWSAADTATTIRLANTPVLGLETINDFPGAGIALIEEEVISYTGKINNATGQYITGVVRGIQGTTRGAHGANKEVRSIPQVVQIVYGASAVEIPTYSDSTRPAFNITNSTNLSWHYRDFFNTAAACGAAWKPMIIRTDSGSGSLYGGSQSNASATASRMGMAMRAAPVGELWIGDHADLRWVLNNPASFWQVTADGAKRRTGASNAWPGHTTGFGRRDPQSLGAVTLWSEANPTNANTWYTWTRPASALGTTGGCPTGVWFIFLGGISASANKEANLEIETVTLDITDDTTPKIRSGSQVPNSYILDAKVFNLTAGSSSIAVSYTKKINDNIEVDTDLKLVTDTQSSTSPLGALRLSSSRYNWFALVPGSNTIQVQESGLEGLFVEVSWRDRMA